ncbi:MAG TPA: TIGR03621 family F420-dependent LLM class oxidoreductase [Candidatus Dormibacteraeota bacterium]|jgi:probable F420-dependent oxidoreductase|nr:TIGR03621 family F420-dependent LLM class oxidoreductase [Candidatus Dormibacteraeota bacterium]
MPDAPKPFRFGLSVLPPRSPLELAERARWAEAHGFSTLLVADHLVPDLLDPFPSLAAAATATSRLRVGTFVINNDLRHPVMLAREAATLDVVSGGRFELGIGAGHMASEYHQAGLTFDRGRVRVERLAESVEILRSLLGGETCTFGGRHYRVDGHKVPEPVQRPRPPLLIGGNGRMVHELAARRADAVGFTGFTHRQGGLEVAPDSFHAEALDAQVARVREQAGDRFEELELNALVQRVVLTEDRSAAVADLAAEGGWPDVDALLQSPYLLVGSVESMTEDLLRRRERFGVSYWVVFDRRGGFDLAPVVERLAGT